MNEEQILKKYPDYKYVGCVNYNQTAFDAYYESKQHESISIGRCLELILLHDTKKIVKRDFGD